MTRNAIDRWNVVAVVRLPAVVRRCPAGVAVLALGAALRVVATITYRPALEYSDSHNYLSIAHHLQAAAWHPIGYPLFLWLFMWTGSLVVPVVVQHLFGLAAGLLVYRLVRRFGAGDLGGALAAAPILLDAWQIDIEQFILSEALFEVLLLTAAVLLLRRPLRAGRVAAAGGLLAAATLTRTVGLAVMGVALIYLLVRRANWRVLAAGVAAAALPLIAYAGAFDASHGEFALQGLSGTYLYGETATFVNCADLHVDATLRKLCPRRPIAERSGSNAFTWGGQSPIHPLVLRNQIAAARTAERFARAAIEAQPLSFARYALDNIGHYFRVGRTSGPRDVTDQAWQFPAMTTPPSVWNLAVGRVSFAQHLVNPTVLSGGASLLRGYQQVAFLPGPALAAAILLGIAGVWVSRRRPNALDGAFVLLSGLALLVISPTTAAFDYRYLLPTLVFIPPAAVLGARALSLRLRDRGFDWRRTPVKLAAAGLIVAALATNLLATNVTPVSRERPSRYVALGTTVPLANGLAVTVSDARLARTGCALPLPHHHDRRVSWVLVFHVRVTDDGGNRWVQPADLQVDGSAADYRAAATPAFGPPLFDEILGPALRGADGQIRVIPASPADRIQYTDPTGAGAAGWTFHIPGADRLPVPGSLCDAGGVT